MGMQAEFKRTYVVTDQRRKRLTGCERNPSGHATQVESAQAQAGVGWMQVESKPTQVMSSSSGGIRQEAGGVRAGAGGDQAYEGGVQADTGGV